MSTANERATWRYSSSSLTRTWSSLTSACWLPARNTRAGSSVSPASSASCIAVARAWPSCTSALSSALGPFLSCRPKRDGVRVCLDVSRLCPCSVPVLIALWNAQSGALAPFAATTLGGAMALGAASYALGGALAGPVARTPLRWDKRDRPRPGLGATADTLGPPKAAGVRKAKTSQRTS